jgi:DNA-binding NtrC family response regulator
MLAATPDGQAMTNSALRGHVFVVDDERLIGEIVSTILSMEGFTTRTFTDPAAALAAFAECAVKPDVLVTDYVMRPLNGMELIQKCRAIHPSVLTLLYSGNVSGHLMDLYAEKPHSFLEKPFHPKKLVRIVRSLIEYRDSCNGAEIPRDKLLA